MSVTGLGERRVKVTLTGRLDTPAVDKLEIRFLAALVPGGNSAIIDLSQVDFVASMGIRMLVSAARGLRTRQAKLVLYRAQARVTEVLEAVALQQIVAMCATEEEALAAVGA